MRVVVAADRVRGLSSLEASSALARAWVAEAGAEVAVVPIGDAGEGLLQALADQVGAVPGLLPARGDFLATAIVHPALVAVALEPITPVPGLSRASSHPLGIALSDALRDQDLATARDVVVDLAWAIGTHDGGAGLLAALGAVSETDLTHGFAPLCEVRRVDLEPAVARLGEAQLIGAVPFGQEEVSLLGLRGISSRRGFEIGGEVAQAMAADAALEAFATATAPAAASRSGAGACGGAGYAVAALGGRIVSGPQLCAERTALATTIGLADLVVTACDGFDFLTRGGGVVQYLAGLCAELGVPLVVCSPRVQISRREMRTIDIEDAYLLDVPEALEADQLTAAARTVAQSWRW